MKKMFLMLCLMVAMLFVFGCGPLVYNSGDGHVVVVPDDSKIGEKLAEGAIKYITGEEVGDTASQIELDVVSKRSEKLESKLEHCYKTCNESDNCDKRKEHASSIGHTVDLAQHETNSRCQKQGCPSL